MTANSVPGRIALVVHPSRDVAEVMDALTRWAAEHGVEVVQLRIGGKRFQQVAELGVLDAADLVIAMGGDGTVLSALRAAAKKNAPVLGVSWGSLGALSAVKVDALPDALENFWAGEWERYSLPALAVSASDAREDWAVNDFVLVRRGSGQLVAEVTVDDELYVRVAGDGVIVATPVGSSAYSMAAGGPVLAADTPGFVCTPLAMHGGSGPPVVVPPDARLTVLVSPTYAGFDVEIDGHRRQWQAHRFEVTLIQDKFTLVRFGPSSHGLEALRRRGLITDSPRVLARDHRASHGVEHPG